MKKHPQPAAMPHSRAWLAVLVAGAALTLAACDKSDNRTAGEKLDSAVRAGRRYRRGQNR